MKTLMKEYKTTNETRPMNSWYEYLEMQRESDILSSEMR